MLLAIGALFLPHFVGRAIHRIAAWLSGPPVSRLVPGMVAEACALLVMVLLMIAFRRRRDVFAFSGLPLDRGGLARLSVGVLSGLAGMALVVGAIACFGSFEILAWKNAFWTGCAVACVSAATYLLVGVFEEAWFRGYAFTVLERSGGFWLAALLTSFLFGAAHGFNPGEGVGSVALIVVAGLFFSLLRRATGSLWYGIGLHAGVDYAEGVIFSGADSGVDTPAEHLLVVRAGGPDWVTGGAAGYENSVFCLLMLLAGPLLLLRRRGRRKVVAA